ncbi:MAG: excinuclease ABC subunit UvrA [Deltaproteobacteria bacterium]|nr:excinuclease ABC subunit UvrA [Deltaproteobacteria bacterium]
MPPRQPITIRGARQHNLRSVTVRIPRGKLVVITGLSGSGKSSIAFDTLYAEGQRRYVESLSVHARHYLEKMPKPDVDSIEGLSPAVSVEQKAPSKNPRSTVGTSTEIYDFLRVLFARTGRPHCPKCGERISSQTPQQIVDSILDMPSGSRFSVLAPIARGRKGGFKRELSKLRREGFVRINVDGDLVELEEVEELDRGRVHDIDVYVDRLIVKPDASRRLAESVELALKVGEGNVKVSVLDSEDLIFSERFACMKCGISLSEVTPRIFSFNNPVGACPDCGGLGVVYQVEPALIVPDPSLSLREGAVAPWRRKSSAYFQNLLEAVGEHYGIDLESPWELLPEEARTLMLEGSDREFEFTFESDEDVHVFKRRFEGVIPNLERRRREYARKTREERRGELDDDQMNHLVEELGRYMLPKPCVSCRGARLRPEVLHVLLDGRNIHDLTRLTIRELRVHLGSMELSSRERKIAKKILKELDQRLGFLEDVGLDYLTLDRAAYTLSGGESQRIHLAGQIGSGLVGVLYILDEPTIGLHQRDNERLIATLEHLKHMGNTVVVVEHDRDMMLAADHIIDMGPGAGIEGGEVVAVGSPDEIMASSASLTGRYLSGDLSIPAPDRRRRPSSLRLTLEGAHLNNLKDVTVHFPLGLLVAVTGVSGSGKSSLVVDTLLPAVRASLGGLMTISVPCTGIKGVHALDKCINIDQSPLGRTPRSNPATYTKIFTDIRELFASLPESRARGYSPGRFSFNVKGGRCEACQGDGLIRIEMHFLPDVYVTCEECQGRRYNRETLDIVHRGRNIAEVLEMTVSEAIPFFGAIPSIRIKLETLADVGLGYLSLGQSATTLSGGEAQRIKLGRELARRATGRTLYILDEPTTGLHFHDIKNLLEVLEKLVEAGNTVVVIEHNLDVIKCADWVIDLGPEGGERGGEVIASGPPEDVALVERSHTGSYLASLLGVSPTRRPSRPPPGPAKPRRGRPRTRA